MFVLIKSYYILDDLLKLMENRKRGMANAGVMMEQIAMYFAGFPCPPLPVMVMGTDDKLKACNSHDIIANMLYVVMKQNNKTLNEKRKKFQMDVTR